MALDAHRPCPKGPGWVWRAPKGLQKGSPEGSPWEALPRAIQLAYCIFGPQDRRGSWSRPVRTRGFCPDLSKCVDFSDFEDLRSIDRPGSRDQDLWIMIPGSQNGSFLDPPGEVPGWPVLVVLLQSSIAPIMPSESPLSPHNASLVTGTLQDLSRGVQKGSQKRSKIGHFRGLEPQIQRI